MRPSSISSYSATSSTHFGALFFKKKDADRLDKVLPNTSEFDHEFFEGSANYSDEDVWFPIKIYRFFAHSAERIARTWAKKNKIEVKDYDDNLFEREKNRRASEN